MRQYGSRTIKVSKQALLEQIKKNKKIHIKEYKLAVSAFKKESMRQLTDLVARVQLGKVTKIKLKLTEPVNNSDNYDKIIEMFQWEIADEVELTQDEFNEYILDESTFSTNAKVSNSYYLG